MILNSLRPVTADDAGPLLEFELANRAYFARSIPDRGDEYFARFADRHAALLAMQAAGTDFFHVVTGADGAILGRVNLVRVADGRAELGYRIAEAAAGRGLATWATGEACRLAADRYQLRMLTAVTTLDNAASRTVLTRTGFTAVREIDIDGQPGLCFELRLNG
ncbi:GNAT family N-acetyltransferase [Hamadaea tsunoensis]|uniref:GNAT family N-acetyltransferase n=1 Tax=Hamadaea tsunoensis TaxID=53368 RepID=UPI0004107CCA|nr:GNAT family N-acetyltransferase [Hamadaea tsunoensis]